MRAARIYGYGGPEVFRVEDAPDPEVRPNDLLVEVHAASVNPVDWKLRRGTHRALVWFKLPWILGLDVSGVVKAVGHKVKGFSVGDEVMASPTHWRHGTYAELVAIDESAAARKPANLTHQQAAAIPLAGLTAWQALVGKGRVSKGHKVLVTAGSGGVGSFGIQIAKYFGATVATTCSGRNARLVTDLGADQVIDYTEANYIDVLRDIDVMLDAHGGDTYGALKVMRGGGCLAWIAPDVAGRTARYGSALGMLSVGVSMVGIIAGARLFYGVRAPHVLMQPNGAQLAELAALCASGSVKPLIDRVYPLADIAEAHRYSETGRARGKIVIAVR